MARIVGMVVCPKTCALRRARLLFPESERTQALVGCTDCRCTDLHFRVCGAKPGSRVADASAQVHGSQGLGLRHSMVEQQVARAPQDMDVRAWRACVLAWAGKPPEAEKEYLEILKVSHTDPDNWMGLASVYLREGRVPEAQRPSALQKSWIRNGLTITPRARGFCGRGARERKRNRSFGRRSIWIRKARRLSIFCILPCV